MARRSAKHAADAFRRGMCGALLPIGSSFTLGLGTHVCQKHAGHADLHECWCEELFDELGLVGVPPGWTCRGLTGNEPR